MRVLILSRCCALLLVALFARTALAHEGPDPVVHWFFTKTTVEGDRIKPRLGPVTRAEGGPAFVEDRFGGALAFDGADDRLIVAADNSDLANRLPRQFLTAAATLTVDRPRAGVAVISLAQIHGEGQKGWFLGYNERAFRFGLASLGRDDGNGRMTIIESRSPIKPGRSHRVVGVYDGRETRLYVDGKLEATSTEQQGPIIYGARTVCVIGAAADTDESVFHRGLIRDIALYDIAATDKWVDHDAEEWGEVAEADSAVRPDDDLQFVVRPYLQMATQTSMTVMWETNHPSLGRVRYGRDEATPSEASGPDATIHEIKLTDLEPETPYYYRAESADTEGLKIASELLSFQTANCPDTPFAFGVIGDTQFNPRVSKILTDMLWMQRPNFFVIAGDLVDTGPEKWQWTEQFFPGISPLASRVCLYPVIGNHEQNTKHYYDYMSLPEPEYYYQFTYGNADFFILDSNKECGPGSEQWNWLAAALEASDAVWKFVSYHHPSYSSDEDDYGDMWRGRSVYGEQRLRPLSQLYDKHGVDIVWNGHIHSYERTWPLKHDKVVEQDGTIYLVTGGGGGGLEVAGPIKPYFQNNVKHGHHYCLVAVNGRTLEFKAFDQEGRLFDYLKIDKRRAGE
jgi:predicted phosphodiesterase